MRQVTVVATIEYQDGRIEYRTYKSTGSPSKLKARIRTYWRALGVKRVICGNYIATNSYGAH